MNSIAICLLLTVLVTGCVAHAQPTASPAPWVPDLGDGTYKNPVLFADYSDPDIVRVGDDFYMTASSFACVPGLPILHSKDLVNWTIIGHAITELPERFNTVQPGKGIWAPSIRYHDGWFWIFVGDPDWGILMTKTKDPAGKWEPLHLVQEGKGLIDTCPLWDDDGKAYLVHAYANSRAGRSDIIVVREMSPEGTKLIGEEHLVIDGRNRAHPTIEGPKFYKRNGWYYILAPSGGVTQGWQIAGRSRTPTGVYETRRVLEKGSTNVNGPHQGGWVSLASGEDWFMHFQDRGAYGRIVHLQPLRWVDDWPMMGEDFDKNGVGEPVSTHKKPNVGKSHPIQNPQTSDEFDGDKLGLQWQWAANPKADWMSLTARPGHLRLSAAANPDRLLALAPSGLLQKFPAPRFTVTTRLEAVPGAGSRAGLTVTGNSSGASSLVIAQGAGGLEIQRITTSGAADVVNATATDIAGPVWLRVSVEPEAVCTFSYSTDGQTFKPLGDAYRARSGGWIGAKVGLLSVGEGGHADFDWFRVE